MLKNDAWNGFEGRIWKLECNVRDFIQNNYTSYDGDESFLEGRQRPPINFGADCRNCRKPNVKTAAFWTRKPR